MIVELGILCASIAALLVAYRVFNAANVSSGWRRMTILLAMPALLVVAIVGIAIQGILIGVAATALILASSLIISTEQWKARGMFQRVADRRLQSDAAMRGEFEKNRILRWVQKRRDQPDDR